MRKAAAGRPHPKSLLRNIMRESVIMLSCYRQLLLLEDDQPKQGRVEEVVWRQHLLRIDDSRLSNDWAHGCGQAVDYRRLTFQNHETG